MPLVLLISAVPTLADPAARALAEAPRWLSAGIVAVAAVFAFPYMWPAYMAVGGLEVRCALRMRGGDDRARALAGRLLLAQATAFAALGIGLALLMRRPAFAAVPVTIALLHIWLAKWISGAPPAQV